MQNPNHAMIYFVGSCLVGVAIVVTTFHFTIGIDRLFAATTESDVTRSTLGQSDDDLDVAVNGSIEERVEALLRITDGRFPLEKVVPVMARATSDADELVRAAGEVGIARIGKKAVPLLSAMIENGYLESNDFAPVCGAAKVLGVDAVELLPEMQNALASDNSATQKIALFAMQNMGDATVKAMDRLIELLDSQDMNVQLGVCRVLERLGPLAAPATDKLVELVDSGTISTKSWASLVLGAIGESDQHDILEILTKQLEAFSLIEKERAMIGLGHMGEKAQAAVEKVTQLMNDPTKHCQPQAAVTLWQITNEPEPSLKVLRELLSTVDYKLTVLELLPTMGPAAAPLTAEIAKDLEFDDVGVREQAALALGKIGPGAKEALPQLKRQLEDKDALLRQAVTDAIAAIEREPESK